MRPPDAEDTDRTRDDRVAESRFAVGTKIGPYDLLEFLGRGTSGEVWLAEKDSAIAKIASRNFVRVFRNVERIGRELANGEKPLVGRIEDFDGK